jgi:hypothetical protein
MILKATTLALAALLYAATFATRLGAQSADPDLGAIVDRFMALERARQAPGATAADVDRLLALMTDSIVYEHPRANARLQGKPMLRQGMLRFLGTVRDARDSVVQRTSAPGVVVIVSETQAEMLRDGAWAPLRRRGLRVFEFDGARVRRIIEYGW